jgi:phage shock protein PspC (stress-responsive transcriptional regulator)
MYCKNCGKEVNEKAIACIHCGVPPLEERKFCQECGCETKENQVVCIKCGVSLEVKKKAIKSSENKGLDGFYCSSDEKIIQGVCGGLGHKYGFSPWIFRLIFFAGTGAIVAIPIYFVLGTKEKIPTKA